MKGQMKGSVWMIMFYCFLTVIEVKVQSTCICNNDDGMKIGRCSGYFSYSDFALCGPPTRLVIIGDAYLNLCEKDSFGALKFSRILKSNITHLHITQNVCKHHKCFCVPQRITVYGCNIQWCKIEKKRTHAHATDLNTTKMTENYDISSNETDVQKEYKSQTRQNTVRRRSVPHTLTHVINKPLTSSVKTIIWDTNITVDILIQHSTFYLGNNTNETFSRLLIDKQKNFDFKFKSDVIESSMSMSTESIGKLTVYLAIIPIIIAIVVGTLVWIHYITPPVYGRLRTSTHHIPSCNESGTEENYLLVIPLEHLEEN